MFRSLEIKISLVLQTSSKVQISRNIIKFRSLEIKINTNIEQQLKIRGGRTVTCTIVIHSLTQIVLLRVQYQQNELLITKHRKRIIRQFVYSNTKVGNSHVVCSCVTIRVPSSIKNLPVVEVLRQV